jgi:hypothetical protein
MNVEKITPEPVEPPPVVRIELSEDEARDLKALLGVIGGTKRSLYMSDPGRPNVRKTTDSLYFALGSAGVGSGGSF